MLGNAQQDVLALLPVQELPTAATLLTQHAFRETMPLSVTVHSRNQEVLLTAMQHAYTFKALKSSTLSSSCVQAWAKVVQQCFV